jgi:hypothetical protein
MAYVVEGGQWEKVKSCRYYVCTLVFCIQNLIYELFATFLRFLFSVLFIMG